MRVAKLLHKLLIVANIEIVVSLLPEMLNQVERWPIQARFWLEWENPSLILSYCVLDFRECRTGNSHRFAGFEPHLELRHFN